MKLKIESSEKNSKLGKYNERNNYNLFSKNN